MPSQVWDSFTKVVKRDHTVAKCIICEIELQFNTKDGSTGSMRKHLLRKHPSALARGRADDKKVSNQTTVLDMIRSKDQLSSTSVRATSLTEAILLMLCTDLQPLSFTEDFGFRSLMKKAEPRYTIPSRATFRRKLIPELYEKTLSKLKEELKQHMSGVKTISITTDGWTARTASSYLTYTLHLIRCDFTMVSYNLGTFEFKKDHSAVNLKHHIYQVLVRCDILQDAASSDERDDERQDMEMVLDEDEDEVEHDVDSDNNGDGDTDSEDEPTLTPLPEGLKIYITTDNARNISKAVEESHFDHVRCFAHTVNLAVQKGLKVTGITSQLARIRKIVKYFRKSNKGKYELQVGV